MSDADNDGILKAAVDWRVRLDRAATPDEIARFKAWLLADERHQAAWQEIERTWALMGAIPKPRDKNRTRRKMRHRSAIRRIGIASLLVCTTFATSLAIFVLGSEALLDADVRTTIGEVRTVSAPDGSTILLNADSAIAMDFDADGRAVRLLRGEAVFSVVSDPRPFVVLTDAGATEALGTAWSVRLDGDEAVVTVLESRVAIKAVSGARKVLTAGHQASYDATSVADVQTVDVEAETAWRRGKLIFVNRPLGDVIEALDRYHPAWLQIVDPSIRQRRVNGVFDLARPDLALAAVTASLNLSSIDLMGMAVILYR